MLITIGTIQVTIRLYWYRGVRAGLFGKKIELSMLIFPLDRESIVSAQVPIPSGGEYSSTISLLTSTLTQILQFCTNTKPLVHIKPTSPKQTLSEILYVFFV